MTNNIPQQSLSGTVATNTLLLPAQVAKQLGVTVETIRHLARKGEITSVKVGRLRRFDADAVTEYLNRNRTPAQAAKE